MKQAVEVDVGPTDTESFTDPDPSAEKEPRQVGQVLAHGVVVGIEDRKPLPHLITGQGSSRTPFPALQIADVPNRVRTQGITTNGQAADTRHA